MRQENIKKKEREKIKINNFFLLNFIYQQIIFFFFKFKRFI